MGGSPPCTLAWPIKIGTDIQVLTAGHCGHYGSNWYHPGNGLVGGKTATQWAPEGRDVMRLQMPNAQASENVYGIASPNPEQLNIVSNPVVGETVCVSLGTSNRNDCGRVESANVRYWSDTVGFWVWGAKLVQADFLPQPIDGDSGAPIGRRYLYTGPGPQHIRHSPLGVLGTEFMEFSKLVSPWQDWGATIWQG